MPAIELQNVVRHARRHVLHETEPAPTLLFDVEADELEDIEAAFAGRRKLAPRDRKRRPSLDRSVEADHEPAARPLRPDDGRVLSAGEYSRSNREAQRVVARILDDEGAVEPMRAADEADRDQLVHLLVDDLELDAFIAMSAARADDGAKRPGD